jgi:hypothetical protein
MWEFEYDNEQGWEFKQLPTLHEDVQPMTRLEFDYSDFDEAE